MRISSERNLTRFCSRLSLADLATISTRARRWPRCGNDDLDLAAAPLAQPVGDDVLHRPSGKACCRTSREGIERGFGVELGHEAADQLGGLVLDTSAHREELGPEQLAISQETDLHAGIASWSLGDRDHIGIGVVRADDLLPLQHMLDRVDPVAHLGRPLEIPGIGGLLHLFLERSQNLVPSAVQEERGVFDRLQILLLTRFADAGRQALLDVVVEAHFVMPGDFLLALAIRKEPVEQIERFVRRSCRCVGAEVAAAILHDAARRDDARPFLVGDLEVGIRLAVLQHDVVFRLQLFDQLVFENQRFCRRIGADELEIGDMPHQLAGLRILAAQRLEIRAHTVAQAPPPCPHRAPCRRHL